MLAVDNVELKINKFNVRSNLNINNNNTVVDIEFNKEINKNEVDNFIKNIGDGTTTNLKKIDKFNYSAKSTAVNNIQKDIRLEQIQLL